MLGMFFVSIYKWLILMDPDVHGEDPVQWITGVRAFAMSVWSVFTVTSLVNHRKRKCHNPILPLSIQGPTGSLRMKTRYQWDKLYKSHFIF